MIFKDLIPGQPFQADNGKLYIKIVEILPQSLAHALPVNAIEINTGSSQYFTRNAYIQPKIIEIKAVTFQ